MNREEELINREYLPQVVYQNILDGKIDIREALISLHISLNSTNEVFISSAKEVLINLTELDLAWEVAQKKINVELYTEEEVYPAEGVHPTEAPILAFLEILLFPENLVNHRFDEEGRVFELHLLGGGEVSIGIFPQQLCKLLFLRDLTLTNQNISTIPSCIRNFTNLKRLNLSGNNITNFPTGIEGLKNLTYIDLSYNKIQELPAYLKNLSNLQQLYLANKELNVPHRNVFECLDISNLKENLSLKTLSEEFAELEKKEQAEREALTKKFNEREEPWKIIYPSKEMLSSFLTKSAKFEFIILWMLNNNFSCEWVDFKNEPLNISPATISYYLNWLSKKRYAFKVENESYMITESGRTRLCKIENSVKNKE